MEANYFKTRMATFNLTVHIVLVTKYRKKVFKKEHLEFLNEAFKSIPDKWDASIVEFSGESDHVHILLTYPPHKLLSGLIANLKSTSSQLLWDNYSDHLKKIWLFVTLYAKSTDKMPRQHTSNPKIPKVSKAIASPFY
jgi:putative transposase